MFALNMQENIKDGVLSAFVDILYSCEGHSNLVILATPGITLMVIMMDSACVVNLMERMQKVFSKFQLLKNIHRLIIYLSKPPWFVSSFLRHPVLK
jgi:hypothetical protein